MFAPASLAGFAQMHNARAPARPILRLCRWVQRARKNFASIFPEKYVEGMTNAECRMTKPREYEAS
jgi:hypothetical protein